MVFAPLLLLAASATFEDSYRAGLLALQRNDLRAAQTSLEVATKIAPGNPRAWVALAQTFWKLKESGKAEAAAAKAETLGRTDAVVLSTLAIYYTESGQALKSAEALARYVGLVPKDIAARERAETIYFELSQPLLQRKKFADAAALLSTGTKLIKDSAQLELALGVACYGLRRFDEAAEAFLRTIAIAPEIDKPYVFLGKFLDQIPSKLPELTRAFAEYEKANPSSFTGYFLHAKALNVQSIEPEMARQLLEKALLLNAGDSSAHFELGVVFDQTERYNEAAREFERAVKLAPDDPAAHYRLSRVYDRLGKHDAAEAERQIHARLEEAQRSAVQ